MRTDTSSARTLLDGDLTVEARDGYVHVWHGRSARSVDELRVVLAEIDEVLGETGTTALMFDSRQADYAEGDVQAKMWAWLSEHPTVKRVATLVESEMLAISVNMRGMSAGVAIKAFADESAAATWLQR